MNMKKIALALVLGCAFVVTAGATPAAAQTLNISIGTDLPNGMKVIVTVAGEGGNCSGAGSGTVRNGSVTISLQLHCTSKTGPNDKVRIYARGEDEAAKQQYKGDGKMTPTSSGVYVSTFKLTKAVPDTPDLR